MSIMLPVFTSLRLLLMCCYQKNPEIAKNVSSRSLDVPLMNYLNRYLSERRSSHFSLTLSEGGSTPVDAHALSSEVVGPMRKLTSVLKAWLKIPRVPQILSHIPRVIVRISGIDLLSSR